MKKMIVKKLISFTLVIGMLFTLGIQVSATSDPGIYIEADGVIYYILEEYDDIGTKIVTVTSNGETTKVISNGETIVIETRESIYSIVDTSSANDFIDEEIEELQQLEITMSSQVYSDSVQGYYYAYSDSGSGNNYTLKIPTSSYKYTTDSSAMEFCNTVLDIKNAYTTALALVGIEIIVALLALGFYSGPAALGILAASGYVGITALTILGAVSNIDTAQKKAENIFNSL